MRRRRVGEPPYQACFLKSWLFVCCFIVSTGNEKTSTALPSKHSTFTNSQTEVSTGNESPNSTSPGNESPNSTSPGTMTTPTPPFSKHTTYTYSPTKGIARIEPIQGFLKYVVYMDGTLTRRIIRCHNSTGSYQKRMQNYMLFQGSMCENDPRGYQGCDRSLPRFDTSRDLLCGDNLCTDNDTVDDGRDPCFIEDDWCRCKIMKPRPEYGNRTYLKSGKDIESKLICDGKCDHYDFYKCEDEAECNGLLFGMYCYDENSQKKGQSKNKYLAPKNICDGHVNCPNGRDERSELCSVTNETKTWCTHFHSNQPVPVYNFTKCPNVDSHPTKHLDLTRWCKEPKIEFSNCSLPDVTVGICRIKGYWSTIYKWGICDPESPVCDDGIDDECVRRPCHLHKHFMCDGIQDCEEGVDETHDTCLSLTESRCERKIGKRGSLRIPSEWLVDGVEDCIDGSDEIGKVCGDGITKRTVSPLSSCENVFICPFEGIIELHELCDGVHTCGNENQICLLSRNKQRYSTTFSNIGQYSSKLSRDLAYCNIRGIESIISLSGEYCVQQTFLFPGHDIFGLTGVSIHLPNKLRDCDHLFGENYLLTSCAGKCTSSPCVLQKVPKYNDCPDHYTDRIGTVVDNLFLSFVMPYHREEDFLIRHFVCDDQTQCIDYSQVCDLVYDCADQSDERYCTNHFKCSTSTSLIPKVKVCDGVIDCIDLSDECNDSCGKQILQSLFLKVTSMVIGGIAFLVNLSIKLSLLIHDTAVMKISLTSLRF